MIYLRLANESDMTLVLAWRNNPQIYQGFYSQSKTNKPIDWETHEDWWESRNEDWATFIVMLYERPIGVVNIGQLDHWSPEIGYYIGNPCDWGKGYGKQAINKVIEFLRKLSQERMHITHIHTTVLKNNERSIKLLKSLGFEYMGEAREGEIWLQRKL